MDIQKIKQTEQALIKHQTILKTAEDLFDTGSFELDIPTGKLTFSDGWLRIHGFTKKTLSVEEVWN